ncbi:MAG: hypothetical protein A2455_11985 [Ignavibacteria bacterium RIFOXYC2_FULL_35_16]|nr:MAG: hypothetical protein A2X60_06195 [Ignavibacteria bacterium GWF2_35_20]OGU82253.1 MAG: hypothetical protein A2254_07090 [Ignavibacteria bacterium RIFOXYA2_FULL_35_9]OGU87809.1 MAG: hypothetical protein A2492_12615 [Ignavibacteria bacterium RIFOXYC12_FULL_35_11]OGU90897.1 MAG: hypothetical protein A3K31_08010 [Ignavibacteria bacterium RIFOXYA12_FULL_35_25]OGU96336.1 MAG: hypothetical protein A2347_05210 [Ignavibacteria bacterium RIFOXYB12_FULL_35_14]OGV01504.1 MAG: hypothetical protein A
MTQRKRENIDISIHLSSTWVCTENNPSFATTNISSILLGAVVLRHADASKKFKVKKNIKNIPATTNTILQIRKMKTIIPVSIFS